MGYHHEPQNRSEKQSKDMYCMEENTVLADGHKVKKIKKDSYEHTY